MATQQHQAATPSPSYEITVHWSEREPAIVSRLDRGQAYELVERLARTAPDQLGEPGVDEAPEPTRLLMGLQAFYRLTVQAGSCDGGAKGFHESQPDVIIGFRHERKAGNIPSEANSTGHDDIGIRSVAT